MNKNSKEEAKENSYDNRLITLAKVNMAQDFERRYEEKHKSQIDEYIAKIDQQDAKIEDQNKTIISINEEIKEKDSKIDQLVEELKEKEAEIESLTETKNLACKIFFEFYKAKTEY